MREGHEVFRVEVHPRVDFRLDSVDNSLSDSTYFKYEEIDSKTVAIKLAQSLEDLVDRVSVTLLHTTLHYLSAGRVYWPCDTRAIESRFGLKISALKV